MPVLFRLPVPTSHTWYLAYGSNLAASKFIHDRGIVPLATAAVTVPNYTLAMDSAGVPYSEPAFASISPMHLTGDSKPVQLIGTAYLLTTEMYVRVLASEGGGIAYTEVELRGTGLTDEDMVKIAAKGGTIAMRSLVTVLPRKAAPSVRYMTLLRTGAAESSMPQAYQLFLARITTYIPSEKLIHRMGAYIFLSFWVPVMSLMEKITKANLKDNQSTAPYWVIVMVRAVVWAMWAYHDHVHAPIWGRGDGLDDSS